ncbi:Transcription factor VOZ1 [Vitis vinifera]|uniref:Transcription factor VOZ1 n=1 Tax=Vitis vinifera TaxID=29760 RepID=A0A438IGQ0_VITVI|nr:Transcription factor VOZ1 [Vitis vinifera]
MMGKGSKSNCKSASHKMFKDKAKNRVDDLQGMFTDLQSARKESRSVDVAVLEEQLHQMLREWKAELNEPSPASSLQGGSLGSFSSDICRLLQLCEEEDDATSALADGAVPKPEPDAQGHQIGASVLFQEVDFLLELFFRLGVLRLICVAYATLTGLNVYGLGELKRVEASLPDGYKDLACCAATKALSWTLSYLEMQHLQPKLVSVAPSNLPNYRLLLHRGLSFDTNPVLMCAQACVHEHLLIVIVSFVFNLFQRYNKGPQEHGFQLVDQCKISPSGAHNMGVHNLEGATQLDYRQFDLQQDFEQNFFAGYDGTGLCGEDAMPHISSFLPSICLPPSAFLGPKCALWDCPRPAQGMDWCQNYCSSFHATLALSEGPPGMTPVLRPGGIGLKDGLLFAALSAKVQGKDVGIPECEGAATAKSPWNAPELFDLSVLEGETIREWLFFDKPRRAFESGNRKQRSLPDYSGRGWHESRKQVMNEYGGLKRSYYMDPQPLNHFEWHLYEYEISKCDACALYRLELKLVDGKKSSKAKATTDSVADLQKQMGRLTAEFPLDNKRSVKGRTKINMKDGVGDVYSTPNRVGPPNQQGDYGVGGPYDYLVENLGDYYLT